MGVAEKRTEKRGTLKKIMLRNKRKKKLIKKTKREINLDVLKKEIGKKDL